MPKYRTLKQFLYQPPKDAKGVAPGPILYPAGVEVDYPGLPSASNLEPLDGAAKKKLAEAEELFEKQRREAKLRQAPAGMELLAALGEMLSQVKGVGRKAKADLDDDEDTKPRAPIVTGEEDKFTKAPDLAKSTSSFGRKHASE